MKRFYRYLAALAAAFILSLPAGAVFKEKNLRSKGLALLILLAGMTILLFSSR